MTKRVSIQLISLASREGVNASKSVDYKLSVSIQLISLASRESITWRLCDRSGRVSIQLISLASRESAVEFTEG